MFCLLQALDVIPQLKATIPIERAQMRLRIVLTGKEARKLQEKVAKLTTSIETEDWNNGELTMVCLIDPGHYREMDDIVRNETKGSGRLELVDLKEVKEGEEVLE
ncbi:hypothetical protein PR048_017436 [Dryococelus australis]|uniref:Ribosome maturation protein SDO1/SBDS C-terminal domain-containing protein n=1 Tax=Dryococelus australis TaxID=614101 RepID=A0ABQ9H9H8_9NEOP|nr:hypothetical protein PR048_017436 [Dryococelus australis]